MLKSYSRSVKGDLFDILHRGLFIEVLKMAGHFKPSLNN